MKDRTLSAEESVQQQIELDVQNAVDDAGFGKFHLKFVAVCSLIVMNTAIGITTIGISVPSAACDLQMTTLDKGRLTAAPMLGMLCGSYFWGCLANIRGRKMTLLAALFLNGCAESISSFVSNFSMFLFLKFVTGFTINGQYTVVFPYLGEFQPTKHRERILCFMELPFTAGIIIAPIIGWAIIPLKFDYSNSHMIFHSWNLFLLICSLPSLCIGFWLLFFPESPKFLVDDGQEQKALEVLAMVYAENKNDSPENYTKKHMRIVEKQMPLAEEENLEAVKPVRKKKSLAKMFQEILVQTATILKPPYLKRTATICCIQFGITSSYYMMVMWFPELFQRFASFEELHPEKSASVCSVSHLSAAVNGTKIIDKDPFGCGYEVQTSVFLQMLFLGLACIPTSIWLPLYVNRWGYRLNLMFFTIASSAVIVGLYFVKSSLQNAFLSCIFEALTSLSITAMFAVVIDLFPTNLRMMAVTLSMFCSRAGALFGNLAFSYLIDYYCVELIVFVSTQLLGSGLLCFFLPGKKPTVVINAATERTAL